MATHGIDPQARGLANRPNLAGIAGLTGTGLVSHTGTGTFSERTITGTTDQITVTNGDGVSGNPTLTLTGNARALYRVKADAVADTIPVAIQVLETQGYTTAGVGGATYVRTSYATITGGSYPAASYFRSTDRFMPDGSTDNTNGGYWVILIPNAGVSIEQMGATSGADAYAAAVAAVAAVSTISSGGVVVFPHVGGGGWQISDGITISTSNVHIELYDDVALTKTTSATAIFFDGGLDASEITNVSLKGIGLRRLVDGNGRNMTDYPAYIEGAMPNASAVMFRNCTNWLCENIHGYNGYVTSIRANYGGYGVVRECDGSDAVYDNGISIEGDPYGTTWSDTDPETWAQVDVVKCSAWGNESFGMTAYAATAVTFSECLAYANGNDDVAKFHDGGGFGAEADSFSTAAVARRDHRVHFHGCRSISNHTQGLHITAAGTVWDGEIDNTIAPVNRPNPNLFWGNNVNIFAAGSLVGSGTNKRAGGGGIHAYATVSGADHFYPSLRWTGEISTTTKGGIYGQGIDWLEVVGAKLKTIGVAAASGVKVENDGANYNDGAGRVLVHECSFEEVTGSAVNITEAGDVDISGLEIKNARTAAAAGQVVYVAKANKAAVQNITNKDANSKTTYIVQLGSAVTVGIARHVSGDSTTPSTLILNQAPTRADRSREIRPILRLIDFPSAGTGGGGCTANTRNVRPLSNEVVNEYAWTLNGGGPYTSVVVPAGTYEIEAYANTYKAGDHVLYLWNLTSGAPAEVGIKAAGDVADGNEQMSFLPRRIYTFTVATELQLQSWTEATRATDGLGKASPAGNPAMMAFLQIWGL